MRINSRASDYRHRITIQEKSESRDAVGSVGVTWSDKYDEMAEIRPIRGKERSSDGKLLSEGMFEIGMRYRDGITQAMRIKFGTRIFKILAINNLGERNIKLLFTCVEEF